MSPETCDVWLMSRKIALRIQFFSCIALSFLLGTWTLLSFQQWMRGDLSILWVCMNVVLAFALAFDIYKILK